MNDADLQDATLRTKYYSKYHSEPHLSRLVFTRKQIEQFVLNSQRMRIEAYKQAQKALKKPFQV